MFAPDHAYSWQHYNSQNVKTTLMSISRGMDNKTWYGHTREYYSAMKRNEALIHATTWVNLKYTQLSETSQTQRAT